MKILLDECLPRRIKRELPGHEVLTVPEAGWASIKNGRLLRLAEVEFDVFITVDRNMPYQQNLVTHKIAIIVLTARRNRFETLQPLIPSLLEALETIQPGDVVHVHA
jgi:predicted nuclease of predicted toxin-antitoxin system